MLNFYHQRAIYFTFNHVIKYRKEKNDYNEKKNKKKIVIYRAKQKGKRFASRNRKV